MTTCPSCGCTRPKTFPYPEGNIYICTNCRLQWGNVDKSSHGGFITSANMHYLDPRSIGDPAHYPPYVEFFAWLSAYAPKGILRILDIGCGGGAFLQHCLDRGHDAWGVEANPKLGHFMSDPVRARVHFGLAEDYSHIGEKFDVITFWDSFEHMEQAFDLLERLQNYLKSNGLIYLRVNNNWDIYNLLTLAALRGAPGLGRKMLKTCFNYPDHCWNFSREAMTRMLAIRGWKVLAVHIGETPASRFSASLLFRLAIRLAYLANTLICGGKIGNYFVARG